ncbi:tRNA intron endonuclease [Panaeolus papilionaceus]|nr:tRNA intron endonuclease [Panaeolus papilionaceus]
MERHPSYPVLAPYIVKYPRAAGSLFQAYNDIVYAQEWTDVMLIDLESCGRAAISGKKRDTDKTLYVVPCSLQESLSFGWVQSAFTELFPSFEQRSLEEIPFLYLGITSSDSSLVYYKLSQGIVKPSV